VIYEVQAKFIESKAKEFLTLLDSETLKNQRPDGPYIIASLNKAAIDSSGLVKWTELCYCPSPLKHERSTVLDKDFTDIKTKPVEKYEEFDGASFIKYLNIISK